MMTSRRRTGVPIRPFTEDNPDLGMLDGYAIQQHLTRRLLESGEVISGYKLGLTSAAMQQLLGVDQPDFGPVFASTVFRDGIEIPVDRFIAPRMEAEIAVVLGAELSGPHCTPADAYVEPLGPTCTPVSAHAGVPSANTAPQASKPSRNHVDPLTNEIGRAHV